MLSDTERLGIAVMLLDKQQGLDEYDRLCRAREQDCGRNGFHNTPAECENFECRNCTMGDIARRDIDCPYVD